MERFFSLAINLFLNIIHSPIIQLIALNNSLIRGLADEIIKLVITLSCFRVISFKNFFRTFSHLSLWLLRQQLL